MRLLRLRGRPVLRGALDRRERRAGAGRRERGNECDRADAVQGRGGLDADVVLAVVCGAQERFNRDGIAKLAERDTSLRAGPRRRNARALRSGVRSRRRHRSARGSTRRDEVWSCAGPPSDGARSVRAEPEQEILGAAATSSSLYSRASTGRRARPRGPLRPSVVQRADTVFGLLLPEPRLCGAVKQRCGEDGGRFGSASLVSALSASARDAPCAGSHAMASAIGTPSPQSYRARMAAHRTRSEGSASALETTGTRLGRRSQRGSGSRLLWSARHVDRLAVRARVAGRCAPRPRQARQRRHDARAQRPSVFSVS